MANRPRQVAVERAAMSRRSQSREQDLSHEFSSQLDNIFSDRVYLAEPWHTDEFLTASESPEYQTTWKLKDKDRLKTAGVALVVCLNLGTDPPDVIKPVPCARRECWTDVSGRMDIGGHKLKTLETVGHELQHQYEKWHSKAKYKQCLDPTSEDLRRVCQNLRKTARNERLLLHYNGHGVPLPTKNGELWVFGRNYTHYMPVPIYELKSWFGDPAVYVLDCSHAGTLMPHFIDMQQLNTSFKFSNELQTGKFNFSTSAVGSQYAQAYHKDGSSSPNRTNHSQSHSMKQQTLPTVSSTASLESMLKLEQQSSTADKKNTAVLDFYSSMEGPTIVLAACTSNEILPLSPLYPADVFTSCLTTPLTIALRWFILQNPFSMDGVSPDQAESIPGRDNDRKTPKGELNWIFTAITDTIAWTTLPSTIFQKMFRSDLLLASLFRNFLLAKRIMKSLNCTPQSWPPLPDSSSHPLWLAWDLATEACLSHVVYMKKGAAMVDPRNNMMPPGGAAGAGGVAGAVGGTAGGSAATSADGGSGANGLGPTPAGAATPHLPAPQNVTDTIMGLPNSEVSHQSTFFTDQLTAFEIWLDFGGEKRIHESPMHLPILLQVLLSQTHRLHALLLLRRYLALGPEAVHLALLVGIFPYILKLLQYPAVEIRQVLVCIWASVLGFDSQCRVDIVNEKSHGCFIQYLACADHPSAQRCMSAFVLSEVCSNYRVGQYHCLQQSMHRTCISIVSQPDAMDSPLLKRWTCLCLFKYCENFGWPKFLCITENCHVKLYSLLEDPDPTVRAAAVLALGEMFGASDPGLASEQGYGSVNSTAVEFSAGNETVGGKAAQQLLREAEQELAMQILESCSDGSVIVRKESLIALFKLFSMPVHASCIRIIALEIMSFPVSDIKHPWIITPEQTRSISDKVVYHIDSVDLFGQMPVAQPEAASKRSSTPRVNVPMDRVNEENSKNGSGSDSPSSASSGSDKKPRENVPEPPTTSPLGRANDGSTALIVDTSIDASTAQTNNADDGIDTTNLPPALPSGSTPGSSSATGAGESKETDTRAQDAAEKAAKETPQTSRSALLAANYIGMWLTLFEIQDKDPHFEVRKSANALIEWMKASAVSIHERNFSRSGGKGAAGRGEDKASKEQQDQSITNTAKQTGEVTTIFGSVDTANTTAGTGSNGNNSIGSKHTGGVFGSKPDNSHSGSGSNSGTTPTPTTPNRRARRMGNALSPMGIAHMSKSPGGLSSSPFGTYAHTFSSSDEDLKKNKSSDVLLDTFPQLPMDDPCLISNLYHSFRMMFLTPDEELEANGDPLSVMGCEKMYRDDKLGAITLAERRLKNLLQLNGGDSLDGIASSFGSPMQQKGLSLHESLYDAPVIEFDDHRVMEKDKDGGKDKHHGKSIQFEQRTILNINNAEITSHVMFHAFLDILAVSDGHSVGVWSLTNGSRIMQINRPCDPTYRLNSRNSRNSERISKEKDRKLNSFSSPSKSGGSSGGGGNSYTGRESIRPGEGDTSCDSGGFTHTRGLIKQSQTNTRITSMTWINESYDALLALGADNGTISIWRDTSTSHVSLGSNSQYTHNKGSGSGNSARGDHSILNASDNINSSLASSFFALPDVAETTRGSGVLMSWQQHSGTMVVGGNSSTIRLWDLGREQCVRVFSTGLDTCTTAIASKSVPSTPPVAGQKGVNPSSVNDEYSLSWTFAGFADGSIGVFDERIQGTGRVATAREHSAWIVAAHFRPDVAEVITASVRGSVKFWDLRTMRSYKTLEVHKSPLTALAVHRCAPIMATGSHAQFIKILTLGGEQLGSIIKYHDGFLGQRIGPVSCLAFHPTKVLLAAGATDSIVSIYGEKKYK